MNHEAEGVEVEAPQSISKRCECPACGGTGITYTEAHRHECEVRYVASMKSKDDRKRYLAGIRKHRGESAVERIKDGLWSLHGTVE